MTGSLVFVKAEDGALRGVSIERVAGKVKEIHRQSVKSRKEEAVHIQGRIDAAGVLDRLR